MPREESPEVLQVASGRLKALFVAISDLAFVLKRGGLIAEFHAPPDHDFLFTPEDVTGKRIMDLLPISLGQQAMYHLEKAFHTKRPQTFSVTYEMGGRTREFQARLAPSSGDEVVALVRDITDSRRLEREILEEIW
jgi:PAS domain-containing protein